MRPDHRSLRIIGPVDEPLAPFAPSHPLTADEVRGICVAVESAFMRLRDLYDAILPLFRDYGFKPPSAGVIARDLSEQIEKSITQHTTTFRPGEGHCDLARLGESWEVKICKDSGLTINQSKVVDGENYIVVNYGETTVKRIWVLWSARDSFFSPRKRNTNARSLLRSQAEWHIEELLA